MSEINLFPRRPSGEVITVGQMVWVNAPEASGACTGWTRGELHVLESGKRERFSTHLALQLSANEVKHIECDVPGTQTIPVEEQEIDSLQDWKSSKLQTLADVEADAMESLGPVDIVPLFLCVYTVASQYE